MSNLLEVRGLRAGYERIPVIFGIDMHVAEGEIVAVLGANGAGKTTSLRCISGMLRPMAGEIAFEGRRIDGRSADAIARSRLVHVPEGRGIFPTLDVNESLELAARMAGVSGGEVHNRVREMYAIFPRLGERRSQLAGTLSGGEQQMLALARGLIVRPRLLLIDEMSQGLAPTVVAQLFELVAGFPQRGTSVLLVEQFVGKALAVASRAYVLEKGKVRYEGDAASLAADPEFVRSSYLGSAEEEVAATGVAAAPRRVRASSGENVTVSLPPALMRSLTERAAREGVAVGELLEQALQGRLAPEPRDEKTAAGAQR
ncbi:MAG TPA: ABC transporter ATP-binding protein [Candidatus Dormibacteraeota bacterium]|jgi:branched-chain amino acid transport system ATP-binding protein|nr:ABC transporter ATP-binding protein [Candidatus Dormibacteraeota bacterium]